MRIALVSDYYDLELGYNKREIALRLHQQGHQLKVITSNRLFPFHNYDETWGKILGSRYKKTGCHREHGVIVDRRPTIWEGFARVWFTGLKTSLLTFKPDLVLVFGIASPSAIRVAALKHQLNCPIGLIDTMVYSELNTGNQLLKKVLYSVFRSCFSKLVGQAATAVIAMQTGTKAVIQAVYGLANPVAVIENGTDTELFRFDAAARAAIRKKYQIPADEFVIIYTGKIIQQKGVHLLVAAYQQLLKTFPDMTLMIVGEGTPEYIRSCQQPLTKSAQAKILWVAAQPQNVLYQYYSAADVAVWPLQESLAMNDAAACQLPLIVNHRMSARVRISRDNALLYQQGNSTDLARQLEQLYTHPKQRQAMGKRGRALMVAELSWDHQVQQILQTLS